MNIAIVGRMTEDDDPWFGVRGDYIKYFSKLGAVSVVAPTNPVDWKPGHYGVVVLPGGADLSPTIYGAVPNISTSRSDPFLEYFDLVLLKETMKKTLVVGICRGFQSLAVTCGLGEYFEQDLPTHPHSAGWTSAGHLIDVFDVSEKWRKTVVSLHHQGIVIKPETISSVFASHGLRLLATAEYNQTEVVVEAFEGVNFLGVQWHPETVGDPTVLRWIDKKLRRSWIRE